MGDEKWWKPRKRVIASTESGRKYPLDIPRIGMDGRGGDKSSSTHKGGTSNKNKALTLLFIPASFTAESPQAGGDRLLYDYL
jgi:hypothetical protein